ncbi:hypothetical protein LTR09_008259 [Extremus antarcticus]|uniref:Uncharacterized protein n=1 Tax=Extremus antarcticus TaxID=702011 RepID=A0AAJ0G6F2_9PEZI|nr:hypothetical protein LTR09_008259 [Extremus antarcticus]
MGFFDVKEAKIKMRGWWCRLKASGCVRGWERKHFVRHDAECPECPRVGSAAQTRKRLQKRRAALPQHIAEKMGKKVPTANEAMRPTSNTCVEDRSRPATDGDLPPMCTDANNAVCTSMMQNQPLVEQLQKAIMQNREVRKEERQAGPRLDKLDQKVLRYDFRIQTIQQEIDDLEGGKEGTSTSQLADLQNRLLHAEKKRDASKAMSLEVDIDLDLKWRDRSQDVGDLLEIFDEILVKNDIIPAEDDVDLEEEDDHPSLASLDVTFDRPITTEVELSPEEREAKTLIDKYVSKRIKFYAVLATFDRREERFVDLEEARDIKKAAGEEVESSLAFDLERLDDTRRYTRNLAEAEEELEDAKAAAVAGGVQVPGSEVESGFVDMVDDGYRVSYDEAIKSLTNPVTVEKWLGGIGEEMLEPEEKVEETVEVDEWDATSVSPWETASAVAEGADRKRIDRWAKACVSS